MALYTTGRLVVDKQSSYTKSRIGRTSSNLDGKANKSLIISGFTRTAGNSSHSFLFNPIKNDDSMSEGDNILDNKDNKLSFWMYLLSSWQNTMCGKGTDLTLIERNPQGTSLICSLCLWCFVKTKSPSVLKYAYASWQNRLRLLRKCKNNARRLCA